MSTLIPATLTERLPLPTPGPGAMGGATVAPSAGELWQMLRRRTVLIAVVFVLLAGTAVGGFVVWYKYFPGFRSECLIECISNIPETALTIEQERLKQEEYERFVLTQALFLKSPTVLGEALKVTAVRSTNWFRSLVDRERDPLLELTDQLMAAPIRGTNLLRVSLECRTKTDPAIIINEVVRYWYDSVRRRSAEEFASKSLQDSEQEASALARQIEQRRNELKSIASRLPAGANENPASNITSQNVAQYGQQVAQMTLELSQLEQLRDLYNDPAGVAVTAEDRVLVEQDPQVAELGRSVFLLEQQLAADRKVFGPNHRIVRQMEAQLVTSQDQLASRRGEVLQQRRNDIREQTNTAYANTLHSLLLAQENLARAEAELQDQDHLLFQYKNLAAEIEQDVEYQLQLSNYIKNLSRVVRQQAAVNVNIAQPAIDPIRQSSPTLVLLPVGVFFAFALSIAVGLAVEFLDKSVRTPQDVTRYLELPMLGVVPDTDDEEVAIERVERATLEHPRSLVAEAFRRIRTNLQFCSPVQRQRVVLVASPRPGDGKSTVACNLAIALAQGGRRVLLVDANLRRPSLQGVFGPAPSTGLTHILVGESTLESCVVKSPVPLLEILGAGRIPPNPTELLGCEAMRQLLNHATTCYDQVILDTSPVLLSSDALVLSTQTDGVILVVRARSNSRGAARRATMLFANLGVHLFGAVLNAAQVTRGGYFREQLRQYYDYQVDADEGSGAGPIVPSPDRGTKGNPT